MIWQATVEKKPTTIIDAVLRLVELIYDSLADNSHLFNVFVYFKKAFDTVSHDMHIIGQIFLHGVR